MLQLLCPTWNSTVVTSRMAHPAILQTYKIIITRYKHISFHVRDRQVSKIHGCCECPYPGPLKLPPGSEAGYHFHLYIDIGGRYDFHNTCRRETAATFHELVESKPSLYSWRQDACPRGTRRNPQTPGTARKQKRQGTPTIITNDHQSPRAVPPGDAMVDIPPIPSSRGYQRCCDLRHLRRRKLNIDNDQCSL